METKAIRPIRNNANIRIVVPQYVNLTVYDCGFSVSVTFNINEYAMHWINNNKGKLFNGIAADYISAYRCCSKGKVRHYVTLRRSYSDLNKIQDATWCVATQDLRMLKIFIREAKIAQLKDEIINI